MDASLSNGVLSVSLPSDGIVHTLSIDKVNNNNNITVTIDSNITNSFAANQVNSLSLFGGTQSRNIIQNNTPLPSFIMGGDQNGDRIFGGSGNDIIVAGHGQTTIYDILGVNNITADNHKQRDVIYSNATSTVTSKDSDENVTFFQPGLTIGSGAIQQIGSTLYIAIGPQASSTQIDGSKGDLTVTSDLGTGTLSSYEFHGVLQIAYFGGPQNDTYINNTDVNDIAYGFSGNDYLAGGFGQRSFLKGSSGNDILIGRADQNDLSANAGTDTLIALNGTDNIFRAAPTDTVIGFTTNDIRLYS